MQVDDSALGDLSRSQLMKSSSQEKFGLDIDNPSCFYLYDKDNAKGVSI